jgi:hypothetical protein
MTAALANDRASAASRECFVMTSAEEILGSVCEAVLLVERIAERL